MSAPSALMCARRLMSNRSDRSNCSGDPEITEIRSRPVWRAQLAAAISRLGKARNSLPWTVGSVIEGRLWHMKHVVERGALPTLRDRERGLALGVLALRNYTRAPEYCRLLLALVDGYDNWAALPDVDPAR